MKGRLVWKGGPGSGHHGHQGRPGQRGGSSPGGGSGGGGGSSANFEHAARTMAMIQGLNPDKTIPPKFIERAKPLQHVFDDMANKKVSEVISKNEYDNMYGGDPPILYSDVSNSSVLDVFASGEYDMMQALSATYGKDGDAANTLMDDLFESW